MTETDLGENVDNRLDAAQAPRAEFSTAAADVRSEDARGAFFSIAKEVMRGSRQPGSARPAYPVGRCNNFRRV